MKNSWFISSNIDSSFKFSNRLKISSKLFLHFDNINFFKKYKNIQVYLEGNVLCRLSTSEKYQSLFNHDLIYKLFNDFGLKFINYVKGNFVIILIFKKQALIFNDQLGIGKFFFDKSEKNYRASNNIEILLKESNSIINLNSFYTYLITNYFLDGFTLFKDIFYSKPSTLLVAGKINKDIRYWNHNQLIVRKYNSSLSSDFTETVRRVFDQYIEIFNPRYIHITLTGGIDSRFVLASLLKLKDKITCLTYGNKKSNDQIKSSIICNKLDINQETYSLKGRPDASFLPVYDFLIENGNTMISINRAHRVFPLITKELDNVSSNLFCGGYLSGEFLDRIHPDNLILSDFSNLLVYGEKNLNDINLDYYLENNFIKFNSEEVDTLHQFLSSKKYYSGNVKFRSFNYLFEVMIPLHYSQDLYFFNKKYGASVIPFLDIDVLTSLFKSKSNMISSRGQSFRIIQKIFNNPRHPLLKVINKSHDVLSKVSFAKKGEYSPKDYFSNTFLFKRFFRSISEPAKPNTFEYDIWYKKFLLSYFKDNETKTFVNNNIDIKNLIKALNTVSGKSEVDYKRFTNLYEVLKNGDKIN